MTRYYKCDKCGCLLWSLGVDKEETLCLHCEGGKYLPCPEPESFHNFGDIDHPTVSC